MSWSVDKPIDFIVPATSSFSVGVVVPIPTLPPVSCNITLPDVSPDLIRQSELTPYPAHDSRVPPKLKTTVP